MRFANLIRMGFIEVEQMSRAKYIARLKAVPQVFSVKKSLAIIILA